MKGTTLACLFIQVQEEVRLGGNVRDQDEDKTCISGNDEIGK